MFYDGVEGDTRAQHTSFNTPSAGHDWNCLEQVGHARTGLAAPAGLATPVRLFWLSRRIISHIQ